jgi:hypothetical protein
VRHFPPWAVDDIRHRAAGNQPHHQLDAFRTRLRTYSMVGICARPLVSSISWSRKHAIPLFDQAGGRPLETEGGGMITETRKIT